MNEEQPVQPANIVNIVAINQGKRPRTMDNPKAHPLTVEEVVEHIKLGNIVVDTRSQALFGSGHIPGSYNIQLSSSEFEQRVGWVTPFDSSMVLVTDTDDQAQRVIYTLAFLGLDQRVKGYLSGGMGAWLEKGMIHKTIPQMTVHQLYDSIMNKEDIKVLDVRDTSEWNVGHIESAYHMNYKHLRERLDSIPVKPEDSVVVLCAGGLRSSTACSILSMNGFNHVYNVTGGMSAWSAANYDMVDFEGCVVATPRAAKPEWFEL